MWMAAADLEKKFPPTFGFRKYAATLHQVLEQQSYDFHSSHIYLLVPIEPIVQPVCLAHSSENTYEPIFCGNIICRVSLFGGLKRRPSKFGGSSVLTALATRIKNTF